MDWSRIDEDYLTALEVVTYYGLISLWVMIPFVGVGVLMYVAYKWGQSARYKAKRKKIPRDFRSGKFHVMTKSEVDTFDQMIKNIDKEYPNGR